MQKNKLDRFIRRAHRIICGCDCTCEQFLTINKMLMHHGLKFLRLCERNPDHPLRCYVPAHLSRSNHFALPFSRTTRRRNSFFSFFCYLDNSLYNGVNLFLYQYLHKCFFCIIRCAAYLSIKCFLWFSFNEINASYLILSYHLKFTLFSTTCIHCKLQTDKSWNCQCNVCLAMLANHG